MKYPSLFLILGLLFGLIAALVNNSYGGSNDVVFDLLIHVAGTFIALSILALIYKLFGEEPTVELLKRLLALHSTSERIASLGVRDFALRRDDFDIKAIHRELSVSKNMFLSSPDFMAIKYTSVQDLLNEYLTHPSKSIRLLIGTNSIAKAQIMEFKASLGIEMQKRLEVRQTNHLTCTFYGSERGVVVTPYLKSRDGSESPALICSPTGNGLHDLFGVYTREFDELFNDAESSL